MKPKRAKRPKGLRGYPTQGPYRQGSIKAERAAKQDTKR